MYTTTDYSLKGLTCTGRAEATALLLDPKTLQAMLSFFDSTMASIQQRWVMLLQTNTLLLQMPLPSTSPTEPLSPDKEAAESFMLDCRIACYKHILREIDQLEAEFERVKALRMVVRGFKDAVERVVQRQCL